VKTEAPITIYNASAGSGKTFTLVKRFLKKLLSAPHPDSYKSYLAITFTNKAVAEMKERIITTLVSFADEKSLASPPIMLQNIARETEIPIQKLHANAKKSLKHLLYNYAQLSVETIDHFNHRLIRTFARDLKLPAHFEVSLDVPQLISEAVDNLVAKAGEDDEITKVLVQFALQKTDEDKSWDISYDISNTAALLLNETDAEHLKKLKDRSLQDFQQFKSTLIKKRSVTLSALKTLAQQTLQTIAEAGLEKTDFNGGSRAYFPNYLEKLAEENLTVSYGAAWQETMGDKPMYPKTKTTDFIASTIDALTQDFIAVFSETKRLVATIWMYDNILKNLTPLSVINLVQQEIELLKEQQNILPISEFNALIHEEIKDQPAPFIYERLGDRYRHFFIDEFQDTSLLQWQNLVPLVDNAVSQEQDGTSGSVLLVGDAKQAIYRWRGGLPEQFMELYSGTNPFSNPKLSIENLETNWRSCETIIDFNNAFFSYVSDHFGDSVHEHLYAIGNQQKTTSKSEGFVQVEFINPENKEESHLLYAERVLETISNLTKTNYQPNDICILTRTKKDGIALSTYLITNEIDVVSSETLLLDFSPLIHCLIAGLTVSLFPENEVAKVGLLTFLHDHFNIETAKHEFLKDCLTSRGDAFASKLETYGISIDITSISEKSLYQACEYMIHHFELNRVADAYLFAFMDLVLDFESRPEAGKLNFLEFWETKKASASVPANNQQNAVTVMTIHKSKGLEFPVVIYPYANTKLYAEQQAKAWFPIDDELFDEALINFNSEVENYGPHGEQLFIERRNTLELDNINLLYVTLTRAIEQLYVFSEVPSKLKLENPDDFNQLLIGYLSQQGLWNPDQMVYSFGSAENTANLPSEEKEKPVNQTMAPKYISSTPETHQLVVASTEASLWQTKAEVAINIGNLLHDTMERIRTKDDITMVIEKYREQKLYPEKTLERLERVLQKIVAHPEIEHLFSNQLEYDTIFNERDIVTSKQQLLRPDRLNFFDNQKVSITDYKTGTPNETHQRQVNLYAETLVGMGFEVLDKFLIYSNGDEISVNKI